jgi:hypothetical protein
MMFDENGVTNGRHRKMPGGKTRSVRYCVYADSGRELFASRFFPDWKKPLTGRVNKSPDAVDSIAKRYESPKRRSEPAQLKRARRVPAITLNNGVDGRRLGWRDGAEVAIGGRQNGVISRQ